MNNWIRIGVKMETKDFDDQIKYLENEAKLMEKVIESDLNMPVELRMSEKERLKLKSDLQKTKNQIISLQEQANKGVDLKSKDTSKNFEDMMKSAKKFTLSLISIRGIYTLLTRASQAYMQVDESTTSQLEANWVGLGTILSPAIELIVKLFKRAVTSILHFMSVLTGVNYIEKANTAILKKQTQATNDLAKANEKATTSFDEMNILSDTSSSTVDDSGIDTSSLFSLNDISESTRKTIEKIAEALKPVYNIVKDIIKFGIEHPDVILGILGGVGLLSMLAKVIGYAGVGTTVGTGLAGILGVLTAIASIGVITISIKLILGEWKKLEEDTDGAEKNIKGVNKRTNEFTKQSIKLGKTVEKNSKQVDNLNKAYSSGANLSLSTLRSQNEEFTKMGDSFLGLEKAIGEVTGETRLLRIAQEASIDEAYNQIVAYYDLYRQGKLNDEQTQDYVDTLKNFVTTVGEGGTSIEELSNKFGLNIEKSEKVQAKYKDVASMLVQVMENSDDTSDSIFNLNGVMDKIPSKIKTSIITDADQTLKDLEETQLLIKNLPTTKDIFIKTKVTAEVEEAKTKLTQLFNNFTPVASNIFKMFGIKFKIPKLAVGGIVNNPSRGVPIGGAIVGEAGREGVIPLTDSQALEELGATIGKYISLNATIPVYVGNRQIAREIKKINADNDFAINR